MILGISDISDQWTNSYDECSQIGKYIEELRAIAKKYQSTPKNVRMVFGFDS